MKRNRNVAVTKIAAIALALSAVASPLAAHAATEPLTNYYTAALNKAGEGIVPGKNAAAVAVARPIAIQAADPLKLAEQYAPDTVGEWKAALADFDALMKEKYGDFTVSTSASAALLPIDAIDGKPVPGTSVPVSSVTLTKAATTDGKTITFHLEEGQTQLVQAQSADGPKQLAAATTKAIPAVTNGAPVANVTTVSIVGSVPAAAAGKTAAADPTASAALAGGATLTIVRDEAQLDPFFASQLALDKAVQAKDAAAIKDALAKLLTQYHSRIDELRKAE